MFPIGDEPNGRRLTPVVNYTLIAINLLIFLYQLTLADRSLEEFIFRWGAIPREIADGQDLYALISSMFLHGGWAHIIGNMLFLWVFGDNVEDTMGHIRYLVFYLLTGIVAGLAQVVIDSNSAIPLVGASGAIAGVLGAYIVLFPKGNIRTLVILGFFITVVMVPAWIQIGLWFVLQFFTGVASLGAETGAGGGVAYFAHIGGFLAGAVLIWLFKDRDAVARQRSARSASRPFQRMDVGRR